MVDPWPRNQAQCLLSEFHLAEQECSHEQLSSLSLMEVPQSTEQLVQGKTIGCGYRGHPPYWKVGLYTAGAEGEVASYS